MPTLTHMYCLYNNQGPIKCHTSCMFLHLSFASFPESAVASHPCSPGGRRRSLRSPHFTVSGQSSLVSVSCPSVCLSWFLFLHGTTDLARTIELCWVNCTRILASACCLLTIVHLSAKLGLQNVAKLRATNQLTQHCMLRL